ncbi:hypothetical protein TorRG33x02_316730 [Trema orientale]|uniref:Uncharacterized protein n=1 Tax=Trema orientale TaxID=63057 RepID=A0A2P5BLI7_TREOI|nr:hypothetical protein TorRG33x02_316730 [Trema orientale]
MAVSNEYTTVRRHFSPPPTSASLKGRCRTSFDHLSITKLCPRAHHLSHRLRTISWSLFTKCPTNVFDESPPSNHRNL